MGERKMYKQIDEIYDAVQEDDLSKVKLLMKQNLDLSSQYENEGNIISVAIKNAGVEVLAEIMGVDYSSKDEIIVLDREKDKLLNSPCDDNGLTPLMKSASCGRRDVVSFLIACGAEVNAVTQNNEAAIDFSLHQADPNITLSLLKADAIFSKFILGREGKGKLKAIIAQNKELQEFFDRRENLHNALKEKRFDPEIEAAFEVEDSLYYINKDGESALWQAACNLNFEAWAYLNDKGVKCTSKSELKEVEVAKLSHEDNFNKSLVKYYFPIKGAHVMKMVSKAKVFRKKRRQEDFGGKVDSFFKALDEDEMTSILLKVLQDEHDLDVVFDFDAWGKEDARHTRIYICAHESEIYTSVDVITTLAHELALQAISLVFQNHGKPYKKDTEEEKEYKEILKEVMNDECFQNCDDIIKRVSNFNEEKWEKELIVVVPEMIAKYREEGSEDGMDRLRKQAPRLLDYYEKYVMQAFQLYVKINFTNNRMTVKIMSEYQKLLSAAQSDQIDVCEDIEDFDNHIYHHNGLAILRVSNMRLAHSHLRNVLQKRRVSLLLMINWSQLIKFESEFSKGLSNGSIGFLAVTWDLENDPPLCKKKRCRGRNCIANIFGGILGNVIVLLPMQFASLEKEPVQYKWMDLSEKTKELIFQKTLVFNGGETTVKKLITAVAREGEENFMATNMCPSDISYLLEEKKILVGKASGWSTGDMMNNSIFYHPDLYIDRSLHQGSVKLTELLFEISSDIFLISDATIPELRKIGIFGPHVSTWNESCATDIIRCFVLDSNSGVDNEDMTFNEICCRYPMKNGIHHLKYKEGELLYIKSSGSVYSLIKYMKYEVVGSSMEEEEFLPQHIHEKPLLTVDNPDEILMPLLIADDPGCGKSFVLYSLASKLKNIFPDVWTAVIDLNFYAQSNSSVCLSELDSVENMNYDKIIDFIYQMVQQGNSSFERTIFTSFCKNRHKVVVMFDGFDEICPTYAEGVLNYLKALMVNTSIKIIVTTRLHEKNDLEISLNSIAYKLVPFSIKEQTEFLNRYWNLCLRSLTRRSRLNKLRNIRSSIERWLRDKDEVDIIHAIQTLDNDILEAETMTNENEDEDHTSMSINFDIYAKKILHGIKILSQNVDQFMQTPLHIQMTGFIAFEEDFNIRISFNLGHLYLRFFEIKMKIFDIEKVLSGENVSAENYSRMVREKSYEILEKLSANVFFEPSCYKFKKKDMENSLSVGLIAVRDEVYQFVHRTFGEFFFAKWLLRKSEKVHVTQFWLDELFAKDGLLSVRCFLDDILYVQSMAVTSSEDNYSVEARFLNPLALPGEEMSRSIHACLFSIIIYCQPSLLQYFVDAFGVEVVKLILKDRNFSAADCKGDMQKFLKRDPLIFLPIHLQLEIKLNISKPVVTCNAISVLMMNENKQGEKFKWVVRKMLTLIGEYGFAEIMSKMIFERGLKWLIPSYIYGKVNEDCVTQLVNFLNGEHKEIFRNSIRKTFLQPGGVWSCVYEKVELYDLMKSLSYGILEKSELSSMIRENPDFFRFWTKTLQCCELPNVRKVWDYIEMALANKEEQLEFMTKSEIGENGDHQPRLVNAITMAALNKDSSIINFIWELAIVLMNKNKYIDWLNQSFICGEPYDDGSLPLKIFNFLAKLISLGNLSEDELGDMILSKDENGKCYFITLINNSISCDGILIYYFYKFLSQSLKNKAEDILKETKPVFWDILTCYQLDECCLAEEWSDIEQEFKNIASCNTFGFIDELQVNDDSTVGRIFPFKDLTPFMELKFCVVRYYKALKLESKCLGRKHFFERLKHDFLGYGNILNYLITSQKNPPMFSCLCKILMKFIESEDMMQYLYLVNNKGNNVFHEAAMDKDYYCWGKVYDVARILLKEMALSEIHSIPNKDGYYLHDLFSKSRWSILMEKINSY